MLYVIGLGLGDAEDITVKGLNTIRICDKIYLENYTSILTVGKDKLEEFYGKPLILADRDMIEQGCDSLLDEAAVKNVALLVVGDPFGATTHVDILLRAREKNVPFTIIHNASIMNAAGCCGLQLYTFGETISIPFWTNTWEPDSFFPRICDNKSRGLHTLCLLDIKVKEPTPESLMKKKREYMPPRFMTVAEAATQLLEVIKRRESISDEYCHLGQDSFAIGLGRVGSAQQRIVFCSLGEMSRYDLGPPLHSLIIPGDMQPLEKEYLSMFSLSCS